MKPSENPLRDTTNDSKWHQEWLQTQQGTFPTFNDYIDYKIRENNYHD